MNLNTLHCTVQPSLESAPAPAAFGYAGGMKAISRRLSAATPPEPPCKSKCIPKGCQHTQGAMSHTRSAHGHPFRMRFFWGVYRWCRCAQPPANGCDASGMCAAVSRACVRRCFRHACYDAYGMRAAMPPACVLRCLWYACCDASGMYAAMSPACVLLRALPLLQPSVMPEA